MNQTFDLPDSTDWLATPLSLLAPLESALRCQVCKDFFENPVITSCSHTFCSLCIRRCLSNEGKCPACRKPDQELKLRQNLTVQELVETFQNARPSVLQLATQAVAAAAATARDDGEDLEQQQPTSKKRKVESSGKTEHGASIASLDANAGAVRSTEGVRTRSQARGGPTQQGLTEVIEVIDDSQDEEFVPADGLVACPVCQRRMKNEAVFSHLDKCTGEPAPRSPPKASYGSLHMQMPAPFPYRNSKSKTPERLPTMNYSLYKESMLRKKLKDLGIPNTGPRALLQRRHTEWVNLWNANCDSKSPKPHGVLLRELDVWERTQGNQPSSSSEAPGSVMRKDFDKAAWSHSHEDDFKRLIANARQKSSAARATSPQISAAQTMQDTPVPEPTQDLISAESTTSPNTMPGDAIVSGAVASETPVPPESSNGQ
ncbi:E3 ubiquitin-protein ligase RAD18 [Aspergillus saccharolyticus JOP 1030-1]|uniref:Postreplication repair E3 ubiquitin-protein ligase RAD18 n=1 Tax=Aspergillus saccharolyticus JOP 1030-1 TaxID=1450539 RepID=A0A318ZDH3_9EURO|nr:DNA repair protein rad18 [Aspergillus saccharolyticus JOP 1030-1]PYH41570.1 DNA repair protein rad18 [Aspergillus saccharolyticus JOP 1030-1]